MSPWQNLSTPRTALHLQHKYAQINEDHALRVVATNDVMLGGGAVSGASIPRPPVLVRFVDALELAVVEPPRDEAAMGPVVLGDFWLVVGRENGDDSMLTMGNCEQDS